MTNFRRDLNNQGCCNAWQHGIRTINGQYPDDNREFGIIEGAGILITPTTAGIKISNLSDPTVLQAGQNIQLTTVGDHLEIATTDNIRVNGDLNVDGDIFQQGASYETHMEQVYTTDDYITMRDGAVTGLSSGQYSGFQVKKYDGTNDGRLVIDNTGTARVGDIGYEQPLLTRSETGSLTNGQSLVWDSGNMKAITQSIPFDIANALAGKEPTLTYNVSNATINGCYIRTETYGKMIVVSCQGGNPTAIGDFEIATGLTKSPYGLIPIISGTDASIKGYLYGLSGKVYMRNNLSGTLDIGFRFVGLLS